jgi:hypothetical protein
MRRALDLYVDFIIGMTARAERASRPRKLVRTAVCAQTAVPQLPQNFEPGGRGLLQFLQGFGSIDWPQLLQNFEPA